MLYWKLESQTQAELSNVGGKVTAQLIQSFSVVVLSATVAGQALAELPVQALIKARGTEWTNNMFCVRRGLTSWHVGFQVACF